MLGFGVKGLGFGIEGLRLKDLGFRVQPGSLGLGFRV